MTAPGPVRVLVVGDQELVRTGFCVILEGADGITVAAEAAKGAEAVRAAAEHQPDVMLMDVRMPEMDGLEATRQITGGSRSAGPRVVMLTTFDLDDYVYEALRAGASGFLLKDAPRHDLIAAVKNTAVGNALLAPSVTIRLIDAFIRTSAHAQPAPSRLASLTAREHDILLRLARGLTNAEIAADLVISEATVKSTSATCSPSSACATGFRLSSWPTRPASSSQANPARRASAQPKRHMPKPGPGCGYPRLALD